MMTKTAELKTMRDAIWASGEFDVAYYMTQVSEDEDKTVDPILHYLEWGSQIGLCPNRIFDPHIYLQLHKDVDDAGVEPFYHYVIQGQSEGRRLKSDNSSGADASSRTELDTADYHLIEDSGLFDEDFYRASVMDIPSNANAIVHYLANSHRWHVDPNPDFDSVFYFSQYPEYRSSGLSPLVHHLKSEGKSLVLPPGDSFEFIDGQRRTDQNVHIERARAATFFYRFGFLAEDDSVLTHLAEASAELANRSPTLRGEAAPDATIIIPVYGQTHFALSCLDSLVRHRSRFTCEILLVDDCSPEASGTDVMRHIPWIRYLRPDRNQGFIGACNFGAAHARGRHLILLNSDTRVCDGWLDELIQTFDDRPMAGFVGSKLFNEDGSLQEAGAIVWRDGSAWNYGRDQDPNDPAYCFARQTDYCSGAAIAIPKELWNTLGGFDDHFRPAYYEDVDLAFRVRAAGFEVWYQSLARVIHFEGKTHGRDETKGVKAYQVENAKKFAERWRGALKTHRINGREPLKEAHRATTSRMLAVDALTPTPDQDAGSVMTIKLLQIFQRLGWHVSFFPAHDTANHSRYTADLQRMGIETFNSPAFHSAEEVARWRPDFYDAVLGFRVTVFGALIDRLRAAYPLARMLFHDIDLHYLRMEREAALSHDARLQSEAEIVHDQELDLIVKSDCVIVPSVTEREIIMEQLPVDNIVVYSYTSDVRRSLATFADRDHLVFVGGFRHSPNVDAVRFFIQDIWPELERTLPEEARFYVVGADAPEDLRELATDRIIFTGYLESLDEVLDICRVFVAPLRYGAGLKGKVVTSLSNGVPCVASSIAIEGMALTPEADVLVADDAETFVTQIRRVYGNAAESLRLQAAGYAFVERHYSWQAGMDVAVEILKTADDAWLRRRRTARQKWIGALSLPGGGGVPQNGTPG